MRSLEALVRWQSPERGLIPPLDFISYAEESGLIVPLGRWVILDVVRQVAKWRDKGINLRVAVNISARQLADQTIFTALKQVLQELNFEYCPIDVELTESCLIENDELALSVIQQFSQLGAQVHLDDFGTGYSSLSQLARFPIDAIKLDQVFVRDIHKQPVSQSLVRAIVAVAQALNLQVIAEGVESAKEDAFLTKNGINERQGFLFAKPMPAVAVKHFSFSGNFCIIHFPPFAIRMSLMSEFDAQRVAERIDIVLDILVAGDYHSAIHNLEILKAELLRQVAESTPDIPKTPWEI